MFFENNLVDLSLINVSAQFFQNNKIFIIRYLREEADRLYQSKLSREESSALGNFSMTKTRTIFDDETLRQVGALPLPNELKTRLKNVIRFMDLQLSKWISTNIELLRWKPTHFPPALHWSSSGKLDVAETVNNIIKNRKINVNQRFMLSCKFCLENEVAPLFSKISTKNKTDFVFKDNKLNMYWMDWLMKKQIVFYCAYNPSNFLDGSYFIRLVEMAIEENNIQIVKYFWNRLSLTDKMVCFEQIFTPSDELFMFYLSQPELPQEWIQAKALIILKNLLNNWLWHDHFFVKLGSCSDSLTDNDFLQLFDYVVENQVRYSVNPELQGLLTKFWRLYKSKVNQGPAFCRVWFKLLKLEHLQSFMMILKDVSSGVLISYLQRLPEIIAILVSLAKYEVLEEILRQAYRTDAGISAFKIGYLIGTQSFSKYILEEGNYILFDQIKRWSCISSEHWDQFKFDVLLNDEVFPILKKLTVNGGCRRLLACFNYLFSTPEELDDYRKEILVPKYADGVFIDLLFHRENIQQNKIFKNFIIADNFLDFCFEDRMKKSFFKKKTLFVKGDQICNLLFRYELFYEYEDFLKQFDLTFEEETEFEKEMFIKRINDRDVVKALLSWSGQQLIERVFNAYLPSELIHTFKREMLLSNNVIKSFKLLLLTSNHFGFVKNVVLWFQPSREDLKTFIKNCRGKFRGMDALHLNYAEIVFFPVLHEIAVNLP